MEPRWAREPEPSERPGQAQMLAPAVAQQGPVQRAPHGPAQAQGHPLHPERRRGPRDSWRRHRNLCRYALDACRCRSRWHRRGLCQPIRQPPSQLHALRAASRRANYPGGPGCWRRNARQVGRRTPPQLSAGRSARQRRELAGGACGRNGAIVAAGPAVAPPERERAGSVARRPVREPALDLPGATRRQRWRG